MGSVIRFARQNKGRGSKAGRLATGIAALLVILLLAISCGRDPTDPSRTDITGLWKSFDRALYIYNIELEITQTEPGLVIGKWRAEGQTDNRCTPVIPCRDSSVIQGRNEVAQVVIELLHAGTFVGELQTSNRLNGIIRAGGENFHVTFAR